MNAPSRKRILINWIVLAGVVVGLVGALGAYYRAVTAPPAKKKGHGRSFKFTVRTAPVEKGALTPSILLQGDVVSRRSATVRAEISGVVKKLAVREGQRVKAGDLLVKLDDRDYVLALRRQQALTVSAHASVLQNRSERTKAKDLERRLKKLHAQKIVSDEEYEKSKLSYQGAQAASAGARAQAALRYAELLSAKRDVQRARIRAPFAGRVSKRLVDVGDRVAVGTSVVELVGGAGLELHIYVPVAEVNRFQPNTPVRYRLAGRRSAWREGTLSRVLPVADPASRNQTVVVALAKPPASYAPGLAVEARLTTGRIADTLIVTTDALARFGERWYVFTVVGGKARRVPVRIVGEDGQRVAVAASLKPGDPVVVVGNEALFPNAPVRVVPRKRPPSSAPSGSPRPRPRSAGGATAGSAGSAR